MSWVNKIFSLVNRVEVINHWVDPNGPRAFEYGRAFVFWEEKAEVELQLQDDGRTLKIFIRKPR